MNNRTALYVTALAVLTSACSTLEPEPKQDLVSMVQLFESLRAEYQVPYSRLGLEDTQLYAYARANNHVVMDEPFASHLTEAAMRFVMVHELTHVRFQDPRQAHQLLKKIHAEQGGDGDQRFMTLLGRYSTHPEFQDFVRLAETRANEAAIDHLANRQMDVCSAIKEIESHTGQRFSVGTDTVCDGATRRAPSDAVEVSYPTGAGPAPSVSESLPSPLPQSVQPHKNEGPEPAETSE